MFFVLFKDAILKDLFIIAAICNLEQFHCVNSTNTQEDVHIGSCPLPSCIAMEIEEISEIVIDIPDTLGHLIVEVMNQPTLRYVRRVIETKLDIIGIILETQYQ